MATETEQAAQTQEEETGQEQATVEPKEKTPAEKLADQYTWDDPGEEEELPSGQGEGEKAAEGAEEQETDTGAAEPKPEPTTDPRLLADAEELGLSRGTAEKLDQAGVLAETINEIVQRIDALGETKEQETKGEPAKEPPPEGEGFKLEIDTEFEDPEVAALLNKMNEHYAGKLSELSKAVEKIRANADEDNQRARVEKFDRGLQELGDEYAEELGTGPGNKLDMASDAFKKRAEVWDMAEVIQRGLAARGKPISDEEARDKALRVVFADKLAAKVRTGVKKELRKQAGQYAEAPTPRKGKGIESLTPRQRAIRVLKEKHGDKFVNAEEEEQEEF